jgi:hypothetical protein
MFNTYFSHNVFPILSNRLEGCHMMSWVIGSAFEVALRPLRHPGALGNCDRKEHLKSSARDRMSVLSSSNQTWLAGNPSLI